MKRKIFYVLMTGLFALTVMQAQTKVWDFATWTAGSAYTATTVVDNLTIEPGGQTTFGVVEANSFSFPDGYVGSMRFKFGGSSAGQDGVLPTTRFLSFPVSGACKIKVWFRTSSSSSARTLKVSDGITVVGSQISGTGSGTDFAVLDVDYAGGPATLYLYGESVNLYKIEVNGSGASTLSNEKFITEPIVSVYSKDQQVFVSNLKSSTEISVYNMLGSLVKNFTTDSDTDFDLKTGLYIVKAQSEEGVKSVKVVVKN